MTSEFNATMSSTAAQGPPHRKPANKVKRAHPQPDLEDKPKASLTKALVNGKSSSKRRKSQKPKSSLSIGDAFGWKTCQGMPLIDRLVIKQVALDEGLQQATELMDKICEPSQIKPEGQKRTPEAIRELDSQLESLQERTDDHTFTIALAGKTGGGKSLLLNTILGEHGLAFSGQSGAATAVVMTVAHGKDYSATVKFYDHKVVLKQVELFINALKRQIEYEEATYDHPSERQQCLAESKAEVAATMAPLKKIWSLEVSTAKTQAAACEDEADVRLMARDLMATNKQATTLLKAGEEEISAENAQELGKLIKPYVTSGGKLRGESFPLWPLVEEVNLFIPSDLLERGVVLVDLPGVGDADAGRDKVTSRYWAKLDAVIVVTDADRGADDTHTHRLLEDSQRIQMQMDGLLNRKSFAVALTKVDDLIIDEYECEEEDDTNYVDELEDFITEKETEIGGLETSVSELDGCLRSAREAILRLEHRQLQSRLHDTDDLKLVKLLLSRAKKSVKFADQKRTFQMETLAETRLEKELAEERRAQTKIAARSSTVCRMLKESSRASMAEKSEPSASKADADEEIEVFATSSRGYWTIKGNATSKPAPMLGIPTDVFTGIPALRQWIMRAAGTHAETHMDAVLEGLSCILHDVDMMLSQFSGSGVTTMGNEEVVAKMQQPLIDHRKRMTNQIEKISESLAGIEPLGDRSLGKKVFVKRAHEIAGSWLFKPSIAATAGRDMVAASTHAAIVARGGDTFISRPVSGLKITYTWMSDITTLCLEQFSQSWQPGITDPVTTMIATVCPSIRRTCSACSSQVYVRLHELGVGSTMSLEALEHATIAAAAALEKDVAELLQSFKRRALRLHHSITYSTLREVFSKVFGDAMALRGPKTFRLRQECLHRGVSENAGLAFDSVCNELLEGLAELVEETKERLTELADGAAGRMRTAIRIGLGKAESLNDADHARVRGLLTAWADTWQKTTVDADHPLKVDVAIPEELTEEHLKDEHPAAQRRASIPEDPMAGKGGAITKEHIIEQVRKMDLEEILRDLRSAGE